MHRLAIVLAVLVLGMGIAAFVLYSDAEWTTVSDEARDAYLLALEAFKKFYREDALREIQRALALDPDFAMAHVLHGVLLRTSGLDGWEDSFTEARRHLDSVSERERLLILTLATRDDIEDEAGAAALEELCVRYHETPEPHMLLAIRYHQNGAIELAIKEYQKLLQIDPNQVLAYNDLGYIYLNTLRFDDAITCFKKYIFVAPEQANPYDSLGECYLRLGRYDEALAQLSIAFSRRPDLTDWSSYLGRGILQHKIYAYCGQGQFTAAMKLTQIQSTDESQEAYVSRRRAEAFIFAAAGRFNRALATVEDVLRRDSEDVSSMAVGARAAAALRSPRLTHKYLQQYLDLAVTPDRCELLGLPGDAGPAEFQARLLADPDPDLRLLMAQFVASDMVARGDHQAAARLLADSLDAASCDPTCWPLWGMMIDAFIETGDMQSAADFCQQLLSINPRHAPTLQSLAEIYHRSGRSDLVEIAAAEYFDVMRAAEPGWPANNLDPDCFADTLR